MQERFGFVDQGYVWIPRNNLGNDAGERLYAVAGVFDRSGITMKRHGRSIYATLFRFGSRGRRYNLTRSFPRWVGSSTRIEIKRFLYYSPDPRAQSVVFEKRLQAGVWFALRSPAPCSLIRSIRLLPSSMSVLCVRYHWQKPGA